MMKLSNKSNLYFLITTLMVFLISGVIIFFLFQHIIKGEVDEELKEQRELIIQQLTELDRFEDLILPEEIIVELSPALTSQTDNNGSFSDTLIQHYDYEDMEYDWEPYRQLRFTITHNNETRLIALRMSLIESDDILETILLSLSLVFVLMIIALIFVNSLTMKRVWQPFQTILHKIDGFDFRSRKDFKSVSTDIKEFNDLNSKLLTMTKKLTEDYFTL